MLAEIGMASLFLSLVAGAIGTLLALYTAFRPNEAVLLSARNAMLAMVVLLTLAAGVLTYAQWIGEYSIVYVASVTNNAQPDLLKITALWGSQAGSLVLWSLMMGVFTVAALWLNWKSDYHLMPWMIVVSGVTLTFFLILNNFYENPFERYWALPNSQIEVSLLKPESDAVLAYPYQSNTQGEVYHTQANVFIPGIPDAEYDGRGLNPLLRHPGMIIHPPMLYLGFTGFVIPFAFAMAALLKGDFSIQWIKATRRWSLVAWMFLSIGIILGGRWAYDVLGWGGYWGWDPVENSSLLPWLTGTAFLHSVMIQEKRGMLKGWNMAMIMLTYLLMLFGTVATRTGLLSSVHTFAQSPLAVPMAGFLAFTVIVCAALFIWRASQGAFENDHYLEGLLSRESLFLFNNWVFLALTAVIFWGTWAELFTGMAVDIGLLDNTITLGPDFYEQWTPALFAILFVLMGVAPLAAWRHASAKAIGKASRLPLAMSAVALVALLAFGKELIVALAVTVVLYAGFATVLEIYKGAEARHRTHKESWPTALSRIVTRNRRRYGGYIIHLGVVILGIGIIASSVFQEVRQDTLAPGETIEIGDYTVRYDEGFNAVAIDDRQMSVANVSLLRGDRVVEELRPRRDFFDFSSTPMTIAGVHSTLENDVYVLFMFQADDEVSFRVYRNPLISFVWFGGVIFVLGTLVAIWPNPEPSTAAQSRRVLAARPAGAGD